VEDESDEGEGKGEEAVEEEVDGEAGCSKDGE
jgi:hypothetical protein